MRGSSSGNVVCLIHKFPATRDLPQQSSRKSGNK